MIEPQSLQLGASCWNRIGAPPFVFTASASFGGRTKPIDGEAAVATASMKVMSFGVGVETLLSDVAGLRAGATLEPATTLEPDTFTSIVSRLITPASSWLSRLRNFVASHLKM